MPKVSRLVVSFVVREVSKALFAMTIPLLKVTLAMISTSKAMKAWAVTYLERGLG